MAPDSGSFHNMREMPDFCAFANKARFIYHRCGVSIEKLFGHANTSIGKATGSPLVIKERWAACSTFNTCKPLMPSVSGGRRDSMAERKASHSERNGSVVANGTSSP